MEKEKEYLKMADVFTLPVKDEDRKSAVEVFSRMVCAPYSVEYTVSLSQYAAHAINSHDELVADNERLRESNKRMAKAIWSKWEREGIFTHNSEGQADIFRELYLCDPSSGSEAE